MAEMGDQDDDMEMVEEELPRLADMDTMAYMPNNEQTAFAKLDLDERCRDVLEDLSKGIRCWDDASGKAGIPPLEEFKKMGLVERSTRDKVAPTLLHVLAKDYKKSYAAYPATILRTVVQHLLDHMDNGCDELGEKADEVPGEPILKLAMTYDNIEFIDLIKECRPDTFSDLLSVQDDQGRNFLHHIYAIPKTFQKPLTLKDVRNKTVELARKYVADAQPEALAARDREGNSAIHYAAEYRQCWGRGEWYVKIFRDMVLRADSVMKVKGEMNNADESPILYCERTRKEFKDTQSKERKVSEKPAMAPPPEPARRPALAALGIVDNVSVMPSWDTSGDQENVQDNDGEEVTIRKLVRSPTSSRDNFGAIKGKPHDFPRRTVERRSSSAAYTTKPFQGVRMKPISTDRQDIPPSQENESAKTTALDTTHTENKPAPPKKNPDKPVDDMLNFLVLHYIRERSDLKARELIYGKYASDKNLYFDASSLRSKSAADVTDLLTRMSVGGFGDVLAYVYLPTILHSRDGDAASQLDKTKKSYTMNKGVPRHAVLAENPKIGRSCLVSVFRKLYDAGVRKILRLTVEDMETPSHTDAAIEECLTGRNYLTQTSDPERAISVEIWDWRRPDLSTDVIAFAAPHVEHVHLYWSGNQTVLRGWACPEGIPRLYNTTKQRLKKVTIDVAPGLETRERMDKMLSRFKAEIQNNTDDSIEIKLNYRMAGLFNKLDQKSRQSAGSTVESTQQHAWITQMEYFRTALIGVHAELGKMSQSVQPERVKVALIDDGVDLSDLDRYNGIVEATGVSYCPPTDYDSERPWHESSSGHGTIMANMIVRINPWALLCVMKLQDGRNKDGSRTIFAASAAEAILGAVGRGVDIISMSWTVRGKIADSLGAKSAGGTAALNMTSYEASSIRKLEYAIVKAKEANILMFCSASDDIRSGGLDSLPYRQSPESIIRIGAALAHGQRDALSEDVKRIDFFFPGNQVAEAWNPRSGNTIKYHDGSSVATALAAGLASLIIYCSVVVRLYHQIKNRPDLDRFYPSAEDLKQCDGMKRAFQNIDSDSWEDKKYLPVWEVFGSAASDVSKLDGKKKLDRLDELVRDLCSKVKKQGSVAL